MTTPAEYRQWAEECLQAMRAAMVPEVKATLRTMAERLLKQAERVERQEHLRGQTPTSNDPDQQDLRQPGAPS